MEETGELARALGQLISAWVVFSPLTGLLLSCSKNNVSNICE